MEINKIYCGDNVKVLRDFPDACIDLTVTSPPYDNLRAYNGYEWEFEALARELYRVTKEGGVVVWVVGDATVNGSETGTSFRQALYFMERSGQTLDDVEKGIPRGFNLHDTMIYEKESITWNETSRRYKQNFEYVFVLSKARAEIFNPIKDVKVKNMKPRLAKGGRNGKNPRYEMVYPNSFTCRGNIWRYVSGNTGDDVTGHPAPFPEALARDHILSWSNPGDLVLDPFVGSGTTPKMAKENGRPWIGIDISKEYCELAERRVLGANVPLFVEA